MHHPPEILLMPPLEGMVRMFSNGDVHWCANPSTVEHGVGPGGFSYGYLRVRFFVLNVDSSYLRGFQRGVFNCSNLGFPLGSFVDSYFLDVVFCYVCVLCCV